MEACKNTLDTNVRYHGGNDTIFTANIQTLGRDRKY